MSIRVQLSAIANISSGKRPLVVSKSPSSGMTTPIVGGGGVSGYTNEPLIQDRALITGRVGTLGKLFAINGPCWPSDNALVLKPKNSEVGWLFLRYALEHRIGEAANMNRGAANPLVTQRDLGTIEVYFPDVSTQEEIAAVLSALDNKIALNRRMNETLEATARALFRDWFIDFGPTRAKTQGVPAWLAPDLWSLFPDRLGDEGVPEGWIMRSVQDVAELRGGKQLDKSRIFETGGIPVFGGAGLMGYTNTANADGYVISVGRVGAYCGQFFAHRGPAWVNNNASHIRAYEAKNSEWLFFGLKEMDMEVIKKGAAQPFVSNGDIAQLPLVWPGINLIAVFNGFLHPLVRRMEANVAESRSLAATRDALLPKLMSGEVRVRDAEALVAA